MTDKRKDNKKDFRKNKVMLAYGVIQLGATVVSAVALVAIALSLCSLKKESNFFNECVEEMKAAGSPTADSVRFCTGG
tara:strand:+ start:67 stop:300 length:234 start_codon:yes stop_codon:yes gene_type:complete